MFSATFLGHQGWLLSSPATRLLIDPLLVEPFGHGGAVGTMYPPRALDPTRLPPIDAVVLTHEHEDHFNIPSLNRLAREIPILLSARSSLAARDILAQMGFRVRLVNGGDVVEVGDLQVHLFNPDVLGSHHDDEWDVVQVLVRDLHGHGSFFSAVDVEETDRTREAIAGLVGQPDLSTVALNAGDFNFSHCGGAFGVPSVATLVPMLTRRRRERPSGTALLCGGGFAFQDDRAWLNPRLFCLDPEELAGALARALPDDRFLVPLPGQTLRLQHHRVVSRQSSSEFLACRPERLWPSRRYTRDDRFLEDYAPVRGREALTPAQLQDLLCELEDLARHLYGRREFKAFQSFGDSELAGRKPLFALVLLGDQGLQTLEYEPQGCRFQPATCEDPVAGYAAGLECWAQDLLAVCRGEIGPSSLLFGRARSWSCAPRALNPTVILFWQFFHPLRRPDTFRRLYRHLLAAEPAQVPRVPGAAAP